MGLAGAGLVIAQAALLGHVIAAAFLQRETIEQLRGALVALVGIALLRGALAWAADFASYHGAAAVRSSLRMCASAHVLDLGPGRLVEERAGELANTLAGGIDALDAYFSRYLPQLMLAVAVPLLVMAWTVPRDLTSAAIMLVTAPLIPLFMVLIGQAASTKTDRQWRTLSLLSAHFLDVVSGLTTLRIFGRSRRQEQAVRRAADQYRAATMGVLRLAFLSALVLELAAALSTALVAVAIGLRLDSGGLAFETGLVILILTPEVYLPLRRLGADFHAGMDALAPAKRVFDLLDSPVRQPGSGRHIPDLARDPIRLRGVSVDHGRGAGLPPTTLVLEPGERVALVGPSGSGKTTLIGLLLGFAHANSGSITVGGVPLEDVSLDAMRAQIGWVPQRPHLFSGTVMDNVRFGDLDASPAAVARAAAQAGLGLPLDTPVGEGGRELSAGQRQRVAIARALVRRPALLLLDEPTANLDVHSQLELSRRLMTLRGVTVLAAAHSPVLAAGADRVLSLE
jgi:thiol reductant ABC exporter CydD subunit